MRALLLGLRRIPFLFAITMILVLAAAKEWYPFSHFPMYSNFEDRTAYLFVTDGEDTPLPLETLFGTRTSNLRKMFERQVKDRGGEDKKARLESRMPAGQSMLRMLRETSSNKAQTDRIPKLRLYHVEIRAKQGRITKEVNLVAEEGV